MEVLNFYFRRQSYCLKISTVAEIINAPPLFPLPGIPPAFEGLFQVRGRIISLLNFSQYFGLDSETLESQVVVFAEPLSQFAIRVPAPMEAKNLEFETTQGKEDSDPVFPILEGTASDGAEIHHLISPSRLVVQAKDLIQRWRKNLEAKNPDR